EHDDPDQPPPARTPQDQRRAGCGRRRSLGQRLARTGGGRRTRASRSGPSTPAPLEPGHPALHRLGALAGPPNNPISRRTAMPTFATPEPISVTLELVIAHVRIVAADRPDTVVEVRPSDPAKKADVTVA